MTGCDVCGGDHEVEACPELGLQAELQDSDNVPELSRSVLAGCGLF